MSGDKLSIVLFFVGTTIAAVMGAFQTVGWRSRAFWAVALIFAVLGCAYYRFAASESLRIAVRTLWALSPFVALTLALLAMSGREPRKPSPPKAPEPPKPVPVLNPALTAEYFNKIVKSETDIESKRRIMAHENQLMKLAGKVLDIKEHVYGSKIAVRIADIGERYSKEIEMIFKADQSDNLAAIKQGDWIEFMGRPRHSGVWGWHLEECEFTGRAEAPTPKRQRRSRTSGV
jgi:DNA-directed RNA polymerase subunit F